MRIQIHCIWITDPDPWLCYKLLKFFLILGKYREKILFWQNFLFCFLIRRKYWYLKNSLVSLVSEWWIFFSLKSDTFCFYFIWYFHLWIRIHKAPEYGWGSRTLLIAPVTAEVSYSGGKWSDGELWWADPGSPWKTGKTVVYYLTCFFSVSLIAGQKLLHCCIIF